MDWNAYFYPSNAQQSYTFLLQESISFYVSIYIYAHIHICELLIQHYNYETQHLYKKCFSINVTRAFTASLTKQNERSSSITSFREHTHNRLITMKNVAQHTRKKTHIRDAQYHSTKNAQASRMSRFNHPSTTTRARIHACALSLSLITSRSSSTAIIARPI